MPLRMAEYYLRVYRRFGRFRILSCSMSANSGCRWTRSWKSPDLSFRYRAVEIRELDGERLRNSERLGSLPVWAAEKLASRSAAELMELGTRVLHAHCIEE